MKLKNAILPVLMATAMSAHSAVLYSETFPNTSGADQLTSSTEVGWVNYLGATTATTSTLSGDRWNVSIANGAGSAVKGYLYKTGTTAVGVAYEDTAFSILPANITDFSFISGNDTAMAMSRFIVQQDGNWFVSSTELGVVGNQGSLAGASPLSLTFNTLSTSWNALTITPGTEITIGAATALSGTSAITRIGVYADSKATTVGNTMRFDNVTINGTVPEPSALLLSALGSLVLLRRKR